MPWKRKKTEGHLVWYEWKWRKGSSTLWNDNVRDLKVCSHCNEIHSSGGYISLCPSQSQIEEKTEKIREGWDDNDWRRALGKVGITQANPITDEHGVSLGYFHGDLAFKHEEKKEAKEQAAVPG